MLWSEICSHLVFQGVNLEKVEERRPLKCSLFSQFSIFTKRLRWKIIKGYQPKTSGKELRLINKAKVGTLF